MNRLNEWSRGQALKAAHLNEPVKVLNDQAKSGGDLINGRHPVGGVRQYRVKEVAKDHLVCYPMRDGETIKTEVKIAKPYLLRYTPFEGETISVEGTDITYTYDATNPEKKRSATDGTDTETQEIQPAYAVFVDDAGYQGDIIMVENVGIGAGLQTDDGERLMLIDKNNDARAWAVEA